jgi:MFS family permease
VWRPTFGSTRDRNTALGAWAAVSDVGGAAGVLFGGLLTEGPGWRWVLFVNVPFSAVAFISAFLLLRRERKDARLDALGGFLVTGGMLLLVYALVKAPDPEQRQLNGPFPTDHRSAACVTATSFRVAVTGVDHSGRRDLDGGHSLDSKILRASARTALVSIPAADTFSSEQTGAPRAPPPSSQGAMSCEAYHALRASQSAR